MINLKKLNYLFVSIIIIIILILLLKFNTSKKNKIIIHNKLVKDKFYSLISIIGKPNYIEKDYQDNMITATWMSPLNNFNDFGKFGGADYIKIHGNPSKKFHPHPANVFLILGKYIFVPEHLFGPLKYASETINIEQLFIPDKYSNIYYNTGKKEMALVTGSCASVTISAITVQFVIDMIKIYKNSNINPLEIYSEFREEYDKRINDYLCGNGITNNIPWYDHTFFEESDTAFLGKNQCNKSNIEEFFTHYPECENLMKKDTNFCKSNPDHKCC